ncbi:MAG: LytTR family DNA-binding domain-containing protein [Saprospiraceae bacterium]|nr:LytTR family DNA-binding domain-containing protein [Saprospiraceae bacterium]
MIRYAIIDDEPIAHRIIQSYGEQLAHLQCQGNCYNALEAMAFLTKQAVDLLFLDINMPKLSGFDLLRSLPHRPAIIITSAHQEHALEGYEWEILDYLLKPFSFDRFLKAVNRFQPIKPVEGSVSVADQYFVKVGKAYHQISLKELLWVEAQGNYCRYQLAGRTIKTHQKISAVENQLPSSAFLRVHKSFLVATAKIESINGNQIFIQDQAIPIGQTYKRSLLQFLSNFRQLD